MQLHFVTKNMSEMLLEDGQYCLGKDPYASTLLGDEFCPCKERMRSLCANKDLDFSCNDLNNQLLPAAFSIFTEVKVLMKHFRQFV